MIGDALFSDDRKKRFWLSRNWAGGEPTTVNFIMLNPSKAGALADDMTVRKGVGFATRWGCNRMVFTNLSAYVSTNPAELPAYEAQDTINLMHIQREIQAADIVVVAWGAIDPRLSLRAGLREVISFVKRQERVMYCIGTTKDGSPRHPSRIGYTSAPVYWTAT